MFTKMNISRREEMHQLQVSQTKLNKLVLKRFFFVVGGGILRPGSRVQLFKYLKNLKKTTSNDDIFLVQYCFQVF